MARAASCVRGAEGAGLWAEKTPRKALGTKDQLLQSHSWPLLKPTVRHRQVKLTLPFHWANSPNDHRTSLLSDVERRAE